MVDAAVISTALEGNGMRRLIYGIAWVAVALGMGLPAEAGHRRGCDIGYEDCAPCAPTYKMVERTIMVPTTEWENRTITVTVCRPEIKERTETIRRVVPEAKDVVRTVTVCVPERRTKEVSYTVLVPEYKDVQNTFTVMVPHQEERTATRVVCRKVPVQETRTVTRDQGRWEFQTVEVPCGTGCDMCDGCAPRRRGLFRRASHCDDCEPCSPPCPPQTTTVTRKVWIPNLVSEEVPYTTYKTERVEQPYTYTVTVCKPEPRTTTSRVRVDRPETRTKEVSFTEIVRKQVDKTFREVSYRTVEEPRTVRYTVLVPHQEERQIRVPVCKWVPKKITCRVPCCD